jgi:hypothetical protein
VVSTEATVATVSNHGSKESTAVQATAMSAVVTVHAVVHMCGVVAVRTVAQHSQQQRSMVVAAVTATAKTLTPRIRCTTLLVSDQKLVHTECIVHCALCAVYI